MVLSAEKRFLMLQKDPNGRNTSLTVRISVVKFHLSIMQKLLLTFSLRIFIIPDVNELFLKTNRRMLHIYRFNKCVQTI